MSISENDRPEATAASEEENYPLKETAAILNERLGLYLSAEQQRGFATGLLIGTAFGAAVLAWNVAATLRRRS
jgi:hypothetical protein